MTAAFLCSSAVFGSCIEFLLSWLSLRRFVGIDQAGGGGLRRKDDRFSVGLLEFGDVVAFDVPELDSKNPRLRPAAALAKLHIAQNRLEGVAACELRKLLI